MVRKPLALPVVVFAATVVAAALLFPEVRSLWEQPFALASLLRGKHVAVLPFASTSSDPNDQAFCDGLLDVVTTGLAKLSEARGRVWVVPVSDIREQRIATPREAGRAVGANLAFAGSFERRGDRVFLSLDLIATRTGRVLRSERIVDDVSDLAIFQDGVVATFARMMNIDPEPHELDPLSAARTDSPVAYDAYLEARGHLQRFVREEQVDAGIALLERALEADPDYPSAHAAMGEACWRKCEATWDTVWIRRATASCERALELDPELPDARITLGLIDVGRGRFEEAVEQFEKALSLDPRSPAAQRELARAYRGLGETERALETCRRAIELRPTYWAGYNLLGDMYYRLGRLEAAATQFLRVIRLAPDNTFGYASLGAVYYLMGRVDEACAACEKSLAIKPNKRALNNLAIIYYKEGKFADAAEMLERTLLHDDRDYRVWGNLGGAYRKLGELERSDACYERAIEMAERFLTVNRRDAAILTNLAGYYVPQAEYGRAVELLDRAVTLAPSDTRVLLAAIHTYEIAGERKKALYAGDRALRLGLREQIESIDDLDELIRDPRYRRMLDELK